MMPYFFQCTGYLACTHFEPYLAPNSMKLASDAMFMESDGVSRKDLKKVKPLYVRKKVSQVMRSLRISLVILMKWNDFFTEYMRRVNRKRKGRAGTTAAAKLSLPTNDSSWVRVIFLDARVFCTSSVYFPTFSSGRLVVLVTVSTKNPKNTSCVDGQVVLSAAKGTPMSAHRS